MATIIVSSGVTSTSVTLNGNDVMEIRGGTAISTNNNGGRDNVSAGGLASKTHLTAGSTEVVSSGASSTSVNGTEYIFSGGAAIATTATGGGKIVVQSGGTISGATIGGLFGGSMQILSGGQTGTPPISFAGAGTLQLDDSVHFSGTLGSFTTGNFLDLRDIAFNSATTVAFAEAPSNTSGTLTVSDGTHTANILLLGQYVTAQFNKSSDGHGGTVITDPPVAQTDLLANPHTT